jgi:ceramide glucosyltransferase
MAEMLSLLFASLLLCLVGASCVLHLVAVTRLRRFLRRAETNGETGPPLTFWRALKAGIPDLAGKLDALVASSQPGDQILVGVDAGGAEVAICEAWRERHADRDIHVVPCEPRRAANPKISKFLQMQSHARHAHWLLTDSEALLTKEFVESFRHEWQASGADAMTAGYQFANSQSFPQVLDALPAAITLWPGLMLAPRIAFTLGACTAIRAGDLESIGGWNSVSDILAEDHELGRRLTQTGKSIGLSRVTLRLDSDLLTFGEYLRHQHRVAVTYRSANPGGTLGLAILHGMPLGVLALVAHPPLWTIALSLVLIRGLLAIVEARIAGEFKGRNALFALVVPLIEGCFWLLAWLPLPVWWAGRWRRVSWSGRIAA